MTATPGDTNSGAQASSAWQHAAEVVTQNPGYTSAELAGLTGIDRYDLARRLPDARAAKRVKNGPTRPCSITGRVVQTWFPAAA